MSDESVIVEEGDDDEVVVIEHQEVDPAAAADSDVQVVDVEEDDVVLIGSNSARGRVRDREVHRQRNDSRPRSRSRSSIPIHYEQEMRRRLSQEWAIEDGQTPTKTLYVSGLPPWTRKRHLLALAAPFGQPEIVVPRSREDSRPSRGFAYVSFPTVEEAKRARAGMRDASIDGCPIRVDFARDRRP